MKFLLTLGVAASMLFATVPANAGDKDVIIGVIGGALGGLIVGEAIGNHHHHRHVRREYYYERQVYRPVCYERYVEVWDYYVRDFVVVRRTVCE